MGTNSTRILRCKMEVDYRTSQMNVYWKDVRKACGQWPSDLEQFKFPAGSVTSASCMSANIALQKNAYFLAPNDDSTGFVKIPVPSSVTESINKGIWRNQVLKG